MRDVVLNSPGTYIGPYRARKAIGLNERISVTRNCVWFGNTADHFIERRAFAEPAADPARHSDVRERGMAATRMVITVAALAALAGCGSAVPGTSTPNGEVSVTEADSGKTVHLRIDQRLRIVLGGHGMQWHRPATPDPVLHLIEASGGYPRQGPAVAVFVAIRSGTASVTSITDHPCLHASPPCKIAQRVWSIRVLIARSN
ncbi:MAG TPA: hypothetical protein VJT16_02930 [Streptosporangiaceae bacterium]|nr:hypothetical protein [Streptosporangiaceae bacterium]